MCPPSSALKTINTSIQNFSNKVTSEAGSIFSGASGVFNTIVNGLTGIVNGGPSQTGWSQAEQNAVDARTVQGGATEARNLKAAASSGVAAIGGGTGVMPSGGAQATVLAANEKAAADTAAQENENLIENYKQGNENWKTATGDLEQAPSVFNSSIAANKEAGDAQTNAETSQQNIDTQSNWAMNDVMKLGTAAVSSAVGGFTGGLGGDLASSFFPKTPATPAAPKQSAAAIEAGD
jgi:phage-related protein